MYIDVSCYCIRNLQKIGSGSYKQKRNSRLGVHVRGPWPGTLNKYFCRIDPRVGRPESERTTFKWLPKDQNSSTSLQNMVFGPKNLKM